MTMTSKIWKAFSIRWWILLTVLGFVLGVLVFVVVIAEFGYANFLDEVAGLVPGLVPGALFGLLLGICQWFTLRRRLPGAGWWILLSVLAYALALPIGIVVSDNTPLPTLGWPGQTASMWHPLSAGLQGAVTGTSIGLPAGLILSLQFRRRRPWRWVFYCSLAWLLSVGVAAAVADSATGLIGSLLAAALLQGWVSAMGINTW